jgi:hypothetical protein
LNAQSIILVVLALSAPAWQLASPLVHMSRQQIAALAAGFDVFATFILTPLVTPDWAYTTMLQIAVPCAAASVVSIVLLSRLAKHNSARPV